MSGRWLRSASWFGVIGGAVALWVIRRRRRATMGALSLPERAVERGKDAAGVVAETTMDLTRPPGAGTP